MVVVTENTRKLFTEARRDRHLVRYYTSRHDTLHALYFDKVSWDNIGRDIFVCILHTEYTQLQTCTWKAQYIILISQHYKFLLIKFM
jgi:hypothetical protein